MRLLPNFPDFSPRIAPEIASFWSFLALLVLAGIFYSVILLNILDRHALVDNLQDKLQKVQAEHRVLEGRIVELHRLNTALLPSNKPGEGLDWETLKYLSFARFSLIAEDEGIIHFKD